MVRRGSTGTRGRAVGKSGRGTAATTKGRRSTPQGDRSAKSAAKSTKGKLTTKAKSTKAKSTKARSTKARSTKAKSTQGAGQGRRGRAQAEDVRSLRGRGDVEGGPMVRADDRADDQGGTWRDAVGRRGRERDDDGRSGSDQRERDDPLRSDDDGDRESGSKDGADTRVPTKARGVPEFSVASIRQFPTGKGPHKIPKQGAAKQSQAQGRGSRRR